MDPKVWSKLLTHHQRGYGVDVEALRDRCPLRRRSGTGPKMGSCGTESDGGGIRVLVPYLVVWGYVGIYRRKEYVGGATGGPRGRGRAQGGAPSTLVTSSEASWSRVQVSWITFGWKITIPKVSFRLDSVWYFVSSKYWKRQKNSNSGLGLRLIG